MQLVITFHGGSGRFGDPLEVHGVLHVVDDVPSEVRPDDVFEACNRIEDLESDCTRLIHRWQRQLRRTIDLGTVVVPSMCVNDTIELVSDAGAHLGGWRCEPIGWSTIAPALRPCPV